MPVVPEKLKIAVTSDEHVSALLYVTPHSKASTTIVLGHGAGANQMSGFMRLFATGLAARGFEVLTFNFLYTEQGRRTPDRTIKLEACYRAVIAAARNHDTLRANRMIIGGKSMGGRIASQVAVGMRDLSGLVFLGYPLHPPGKPEQLRDKHLKEIQAPMLFVQGSRDAFGSPEELRRVFTELPHENATLYVVEGGDHSLNVPKSLNIKQQQVYDSVMDEISRWARNQ